MRSEVRPQSRSSETLQMVNPKVDYCRINVSPVSLASGEIFGTQKKWVAKTIEKKRSSGEDNESGVARAKGWNRRKEAR